MRSHDLSDVGQAPHLWDLSRQEIDRGSLQITFIFRLGRNSEEGAEWMLEGVVIHCKHKQPIQARSL